eukprot:CAMPEP_0204157142 /NCGR_PEP_ID=MMETSP0361-20130328/31004_1 /ASSEMBLY_ACC=CAM_ASM_000343 /TAXON_ID=268821 /ORGANISM="Scrippsiella Hangoei, Strain SHTV-5" /LENGTH=122 /DNA_ID=CAMNT_0051112875 /DNA_START=17 /DNA_END=381 /DNA_ORIENTATION=+
MASSAVRRCLARSSSNRLPCCFATTRASMRRLLASSRPLATSSAACRSASCASARSRASALARSCLALTEASRRRVRSTATAQSEASPSAPLPPTPIHRLWPRLGAMGGREGTVAAAMDPPP